MVWCGMAHLGIPGIMSLKFPFPSRSILFSNSRSLPIKRKWIFNFPSRSWEPKSPSRSPLDGYGAEWVLEDDDLIVDDDNGQGWVLGALRQPWGSSAAAHYQIIISLIHLSLFIFWQGYKKETHIPIFDKVSCFGKDFARLDSSS